MDKYERTVVCQLCRVSIFENFLSAFGCAQLYSAERGRVPSLFCKRNRHEVIERQSIPDFTGNISFLCVENFPIKNMANLSQALRCDTRCLSNLIRYYSKRKEERQRVRFIALHTFESYTCQNKKHATLIAIYIQFLQ